MFERELNFMYKNQFKQINHFKKFPSLMPFVGSKYNSLTENKILLLGESHYLPNYSKISANADDWYNKDQSYLNDEETQWIHTSNILNGNLKSKGHYIYRELNRCLEHVFPKDPRPLDHICFMNSFQRPSQESGVTIKHSLKKIDKTVAINTINDTIKIIQPAKIIFVSKLAWKHLGEKVRQDNNSKIIDFTCHPCTGGRFWHKKNYASGIDKFLKLIDD